MIPNLSFLQVYFTIMFWHDKILSITNKKHCFLKIPLSVSKLYIILDHLLMQRKRSKCTRVQLGCYWGQAILGTSPDRLPRNEDQSEMPPFCQVAWDGDGNAEITLPGHYKGKDNRCVIDVVAFVSVDGGDDNGGGSPHAVVVMVLLDVVSLFDNVFPF